MSYVRDSGTWIRRIMYKWNNRKNEQAHLPNAPSLLDNDI